MDYTSASSATGGAQRVGPAAQAVAFAAAATVGGGGRSIRDLFTKARVPYCVTHSSSSVRFADRGGVKQEGEVGHVNPGRESGEGNAVHPPQRASAVRAREDRATGDDGGGSGPASEAVRAAIPLGVAAIVVVFTAIGLEGEVLSRFIRTNPLQVTVAFTLAIVGLVLPIIVSVFTTRTREGSWWRVLPPVVGGALVLAGAVVGLWSGTRNISDREQPDIEIATVRVTAEDGAEAGVEVSVTATGASLAPADRMLLRVVALGPGLPTHVQNALCWNGAMVGEIPEDARGLIEPSSMDSTFRVLHWGENAPDAVGGAAASGRILVPAEYTHVCVYAGLSQDRRALESGNGTSEARYSRAIVDLRSSPLTAPTEAGEGEPPSPAVDPKPAETTD